MRHWYAAYGQAIGLGGSLESTQWARDTKAAKTLLGKYQMTEGLGIIKAFLADQWWRDHCDGNLARVIGRADVLKLQAAGRIKPAQQNTACRSSRMIEQSVSIIDFTNKDA